MRDSNRNDGPETVRYRVTRRPLALILAVLLLALAVNERPTRGQKCEAKPLSLVFSFRQQTVCTDIVDKFPNATPLTAPLTCHNCNLPVIVGDTLRNFRGDMFNVSHSNVRSIDRGAFDTFWPTVKKFKFNDNRINYIETGVFHNFTGLIELNFARNNLTVLLPNQFEGVNVDTLDLSSNQLTQITDVFNGLTVTYLNLSYNQIDKVPVGVFYGMTVQRYYSHYSMVDRQINLAANRIAELEQGSFATKGDLETINLRGNAIAAIRNDTFNNARLRMLDLSGNRIETIESRAFADLAALRTLLLSDNCLDHVPLGAFSFSRNLETLKLDGNRFKTLQSLTFSGASYVRALNLSNNEIDDVTESLMVPLGNIVELDVSYNRIHTLNLKKILEHNHKLRKVYVGHNFWECNELIKNYKLLNSKSGSFEGTGTEYHVPNLHGIACSITPIAVTADMSYDDFLARIARDVNVEDLYKVELKSPDEPDANQLLTSYVSNIYYLLLVLTLVVALFYANVLLKCLCLFLQKRNIVSKNFTIFYNNETDVRLI